MATWWTAPKWRRSPSERTLSGFVSGLAGMGSVWASGVWNTWTDMQPSDYRDVALPAGHRSVVGKIPDGGEQVFRLRQSAGLDIRVVGDPGVLGRYPPHRGIEVLEQLLRDAG